ncbi:hypothetical protein PUG42_04450 [Erwiniaceae bacterium L1_54_3]|nr:hypothetical protein [Pantoea formicae]MDF7647795.1 hypothetical protein [Erwiniaceae bacterium L1_54_3]
MTCVTPSPNQRLPCMRHSQLPQSARYFVVEDGNLVTGQNPASSEDVAKALLLQLAAQRT